MRHQYFMNGTRLEEVEEEKDLGVWVETTMTPNKQCDIAAKKANHVLGMIVRSFHYRKSWKSWCPWHEGDIRKLKGPRDLYAFSQTRKVQRKKKGLKPSGLQLYRHGKKEEISSRHLSA